MKKLLILFLLILGCSNEKICYPSPVIGQEDMCHTKAEWKVISDENWSAINCMNRDDKGNGLTEKQYNLALKRCNLKFDKWYTNEKIK